MHSSRMRTDRGSCHLMPGGHQVRHHLGRHLQADTPK